MTRGEFSSADLVRGFHRRRQLLDQAGPKLKSIIEWNPDAIQIANALDQERRLRGVRGPMHGIPVLIKDNLDTGDRMQTTAGSLALLGTPAPHDAFVVERLRAAGCVVLGKTNLSEWANFRGAHSSSGWSGRGGQTRNPYILDRNPSGSSSGSAAAVAANLCAVAVGTETDGSIVSPAAHCGVVGLKPTVGLISRRGIIPISASQDTAGPMARTVADVAALLGAMVGADTVDDATTVRPESGLVDYQRFLQVDALRGARIGVPRSAFHVHRLADPVFADAIAALRGAGAMLVDPIELPSFEGVGEAEFTVLLYEFKAGLNAYFAARGATSAVPSLAALIEFNEREKARELPYFGQETLIQAQAVGNLDEPRYLSARDRCARWRRELGEFFQTEKLAAIVLPTAGPADTLDALHGDHGRGGSSSYAAVAGFPNITVPCGSVWGLPVGLSFMGPAWHEPELIALAYSFEQATRARKPPGFRPALAARSSGE